MAITQEFIKKLRDTDMKHKLREITPTVGRGTHLKRSNNAYRNRVIDALIKDVPLYYSEELDCVVTKYQDNNGYPIYQSGWPEGFTHRLDPSKVTEATREDVLDNHYWRSYV